MPYLPGVTRLNDFIENLAQSPEQARADNLRRWASSVPGTTPIAEIEARRKQRVAGVVQNIRIDPRPTSRSVEATIIDGSGSMLIKWLGRPTIADLRLGIGLIALGTVGRFDSGELVILNPEHELVTDPEHG
jgi:hypothetical protein